MTDTTNTLTLTILATCPRCGGCGLVQHTGPCNHQGPLDPLPSLQVQLAFEDTVHANVNDILTVKG